jgi:hypothetical protein
VGRQHAALHIHHEQPHHDCHLCALGWGGLDLQQQQGLLHQRVVCSRGQACADAQGARPLGQHVGAQHRGCAAVGRV